MFAASAIAAGALSGFAFGVAFAVIATAVGVETPVGFWPVVALVLTALTLDVVHVRFGRPRPLAVHRQVPQQWGKLLAAPTVGALYGTRLGVGPLTMLTTWLWWAAMIGASALSVWASVGTGVMFGAVRVLVNELAARQISAGGLRKIERLGAMSKRSWMTIDGSTLVGLVVVVLIASGCVASNDVVASNEVEVQGESQSSGQAGTEVSAGGNEGPSQAIQTATEEATSEPSEEDESMQLSGSTPGSDAETDDEASGSGTSDTDAAPTIWQPSASEELSSALIQNVEWFNRLDEPGADHYLDINAASNRQPDPTEELPLLETRGFLGGWSRVFRNDTQDVVVAQVYEFATVDDAAFYLEDGFITLTGYGVDLFDIESLEGVRGFRQETADDIGPIVNFGLAYADQNRWFLLTLTGDPQTATLDILVSAMQAQLQIGGG